MTQEEFDSTRWMKGVKILTTGTDAIFNVNSVNFYRRDVFALGVGILIGKHFDWREIIKVIPSTRKKKKKGK